MTSLPYDSLAERSVAGSLLAGVGWDQLGELETIDVFGEREREIIRAALNLRDQGETVDALAVIDALQRDGRLSPAWPSAYEAAGYMSQLMDETPPGIDIQRAAERIVNLARKRQAVVSAKNLVAGLADPTADPQDIAATASRIADLIGDKQHHKPRAEIFLMNVADVEP